jgi:6-phosphogluconolactonase
MKILESSTKFSAKRYNNMAVLKTIKGFSIMPSAKQKKPNVEIVADAEAAAQKCLDLLVDAANRAIKTKGVFHFAVSGGHSPIRFFELLGMEQKSLALSWDKIHLFWVDERYVPRDSPLSNYKLAADTFLAKVPIPKENVHPIPTEGENFIASARQYEKTIRSVFQLKAGHLPVFDFIILGMGADGHTGSMFPNSYATFDTKDIACVVYLLDQKLPDQTVNRITLTHPVLCAASQLAVLVTGPEKAEILKEVLTGPPDEVRYPIHSLWPALDKIIWLVDSPAAKLL